jgi:putative hydrolase of the HAD superfamily
VRALLLDLDGTLLDHRAAADAAVAAWCAGVVDVVPDDLVPRWQALEEHHTARVERGEVDYRVARRDRLGELRAHLGLAPCDDSALDACFAAVARHYEAAWSSYDDVDAAFASWRDAGVRIGMVTNGVREQALRKLEALGIADDVRVLVAVDDLGVGKPDPRVFLTACERLGVAPEDTVYVGDDITRDVFGPVACGLTGVWLDRFGAEVPRGVDVVVRDLSQVLPLLS